MKTYLAVLAALLSGSVLADSGCANVMGEHSGTFSVAAESTGGKGKVTGIWTADINAKCEVSGFLDAAPYGRVDSAVGRYWPATAQEDKLNPAHINWQFAEKNITLSMGVLGNKDGKSIHGILDNNRYVGDFVVDRFEKPSTTSWKPPEGNKEIPIGVVSEFMANNLFQKIVARGDIPFEWVYGESQFRAGKVALVLDDAGVLPAKDFVEGKIYLDSNPEFGDRRVRLGKSREAGFRYYVGIMIMVKKGNELVPYVLDPSLFTMPVPQTVWKAKLLAKSKSELEHEYFTDRFVMFLEDKDKNLKDYRDSDLDEMDQQLQRNSRDLLVYSKCRFGC